MSLSAQSFGLGLRPQHYQSVLTEKPDLDFFEIISENYLIRGGKPLAMLAQIRADYPIVMHGVSLSIGAPEPLDMNYLSRLRSLIEVVEPAWVSDHLCWTGAHGKNLHDLLPLPYTEDSLAHVVSKVQQVQEFLGRPLVLENPSTYLEFNTNTLSEAAFFAALSQQTGCEILLDVNNVYVNSMNHGIDAKAYIAALPVQQIKQIHLAGHTDQGDPNCPLIIDTHDHPVADPVWDLYAWVCATLGPVATMIERDDDIPALHVLVAELAQARRIAKTTITAPAHIPEAA